jgi:hypothetical protein
MISAVANLEAGDWGRDAPALVRWVMVAEAAGGLWIDPCDGGWPRILQRHGAKCRNEPGHGPVSWVGRMIWHSGSCQRAAHAGGMSGGRAAGRYNKSLVVLVSYFEQI